MACAELHPIASEGGPSSSGAPGDRGLGEMVAALSKTLCRLDHKVTVAMPRYRCIDDAGLMLARRLMPIRLEVPGAAGSGGEVVEGMLFDARLASGVELMVIDLPGMFDRPGIYGEGGEPYPDNARRFGLFCRALAQVVARRNQQGQGFDVVHAHDWPTALLPFLLRDQPVRRVLTVHDARNQGQFPKSAVDDIGLSWSDFHPAGLEFYDRLNMLKAGVLAADVVTTTSPSAARALVGPAGGEGAGGEGLEGVFRARQADLVGIVNGLDYARWSPSTDPHLPARYDAEDVANKGRCKATLLHRLEMGLEPEQPLIVALGPVTVAHGFDLVVEALDALATSGAQLIVAGEGDPALTVPLQAASEELAEVKYLPELNERLRHQLLAAADLVLVAPRHGGGSELERQAQRYGAVPVAHATGVILDTVVDCDRRCETGTGFLFHEPTAPALIGATQRALTALRTPVWAGLRRRVMRLDLSWERPAHRYVRVYRKPAAPIAE